ncbi:uncharacterized protein LOC127796953 [Diospyros lotus]|uniref:uncharacterized protein LOC127796953 n=1 Tax=Diospyros lotus TaxID=55363 RepID=UPI002250D803|nr:uncharacterized protein LOC127796953 [Diospyros lotus]
MMSWKGRDGRHHEHEMEMKNYNKRFTCDGCKQEGLGSRYRCHHCDYELHEECNFPKPTISHDFFPGCSFHFHSRPPTRCGDNRCKQHARCCDACGKDVHGYVYHCPDEGWDLHPCCTNLQTKFCIDGTLFLLRDGVFSRCVWCKKKKLWGGRSHVRGWSYVSECGKYHFHVNCVGKMAQEAWKEGDEDDDACMALEKMVDLRVLAKYSKPSRDRGSKFWKTAWMLLKTILGIILGDPTTLAFSLVDLLSQ